MTPADFKTLADAAFNAGAGVCLALLGVSAVLVAFGYLCELARTRPEE